MRNKHRGLLINGLMILALFNVISSSVHAAIFKCVNTEGETYYNDKPCPKSNAETKIKAMKDPKGGYKRSYINRDKKNKVSSSKNNRRKEKNDTKKIGVKKAKNIKKTSNMGGQDTSKNTVTSSEPVKRSSGVSGGSSAIDSTKDRDLSVVTPSHLFH